MDKKIDLLEGPIFQSLTKLALPIMATFLIQMAYNLIDMMWIGKLGSHAIASVGAAGMYMWFASGLSALPQTGGQIMVGQAIGAGKKENARDYASSAIMLAICYGILLTVFIFSMATPLIHFLKLNGERVILDGVRYLRIVSVGILFNFMNQVLTGIFTALGNSNVSFRTNKCGILLNLVLDPVLIFGVGFLPAMGVTGAAVATTVSQGIVMLLFWNECRKEKDILHNLKVWRKPNGKCLLQINKVGLPVSLQSMMFTGISMVISRLIASFGDYAVAIQKVGSQIESITWMTAEGFSAAVNTFVAQNYGAGNKERVKKGYFTSMVVVVLWGILCTILLIVFPEQVMRLFIREKDVIPMGATYLQIVGYSQFFMCIEIATQGAFGGFGKTIPPFIVSAVFTFARIPVAKILCRTFLGLNGVWWTLTFSCVCKGIILVLWFSLFLRKYQKDSVF